jgi:hypothetical protein
MNNKYKNSLLLFTLSLLSLASCSDWLDIQPRDKMLEREQYATEEAVNSALNGLYRQMMSKTLYSGNLTQTHIERMAHYYYVATNTDAGDMVAYKKFTDLEYKEETVKSAFSAIWSASYQVVFHINNFLLSLEESPAVLSADKKNQMMGEAIGLRAFLLFDLFRLFGPIYDPAHPEVTSIPYNNTAAPIIYENEKAGDFIEKLIADLDTAAVLLQNDPIITDDLSVTTDLQQGFYDKNRNRRMNYYAVQALKARVLQYAGRHLEAATIALNVIQGTMINRRFRLITNATMTDDDDYSRFREVIFGVNNMDMFSDARTRYFGSSLYNGYYIAENTLLTIYNSDEAVTEVEHKEDLRTQQWEKRTFGNRSYYVNKRYLAESSVIPASGSFQPLIRLTELFYIVGEAAALGKIEGVTADDIINIVLQARNFNVEHRLKENATLNEVRSLLDMEYLREFVGEGQAFFYNKRNSRVPFLNCKDGESGFVYYPNRTLEEQYVIPLPDSESNILFGKTTTGN